MRTDEIQALQLKANEIRRDLIKMLAAARSGHTAGPLGIADVFTALYFSVMRHDPKRPNWPDRDRLILSNGHIVPILYTTLAHAGYFPRKELMTLRQLGTRLHGHPHYKALPGIENSAGPLGQGISVAAGVALGAKMDKKNFTVYCSMGDGELDEGQVWEAFMFAAKYELDNLIVFIDRNYIQIDGNTEDVMPLDLLKRKLAAFNWNVVQIDGNRMKTVLTAFKEAKRTRGTPTAIIANTTPGKGVSFMEGKYEWHGKPPTPDQADIAVKELCGEVSHLKGTACKGCEEIIETCECIEGE